MPESSASAGSLLRRLTWRALASAFSTKVLCGSSASSMPSCACVRTSMPSGCSRNWNSRSLPGLLEARTSFFTDVARKNNRAFSGCQCSALHFDQLCDAGLCQLQQFIHFGACEGVAFRRALHLDEVTVAQHHYIHVGVTGRVFSVIQIKYRHAFVDADRDRSDKIFERIFFDQSLAHQTGDRIVQRDKRAGDAGGTRAAIGLDHIAIDLDGALAEFSYIDYRAQAAANQALDFLGASGLFAPGRFARHAFIGGARQHAVFRRDPALAAAFFVRRHLFIDAGGADDLGVAALDQYRPLGVPGVMAGDADLTQLVGCSGAWAHDGFSL